MLSFNFYAPCQYNEGNKRRFHSTGRSRLRMLAKALGLDKDTYDLRSNKGGIAVSGEVTLHGEHVYVQICQPHNDEGVDSGIMFRRCKGRKDYTGGPNHFAPLYMLNTIEALATRIEGNLGPCYKLNANEVEHV